MSGPKVRGRLAEACMAWREPDRTNDRPATRTNRTLPDVYISLSWCVEVGDATIADQTTAQTVFLIACHLPLTQSRSMTRGNSTGLGKRNNKEQLHDEPDVGDAT